MRLAILDRGHSLGTKALFALIRTFSRQPVLEVIKLVKYRPDFCSAQEVTHEAMRGPSAWSAGDRELMAAFVAKNNECEWCTRAHTAVAKRAYRDEGRVAAVLSDFEAAPIEEGLRATLRMLRKLMREHAVTADDMRTVLSSGVSLRAGQRCTCSVLRFQHYSATGEQLRIRPLSPDAFDAGAKYLLARGYR
jgi:AhpD family alkylhydroperoxidase